MKGRRFDLNIWGVVLSLILVFINHCLHNRHTAPQIVWPVLFTTELNFSVVS